MARLLMSTLRDRTECRLRGATGRRPFAQRAGKREDMLTDLLEYRQAGTRVNVNPELGPLQSCRTDRNRFFFLGGG